jgi:putative transposase
MTAMLRGEGIPINRKRVQRLMRRMGIAGLGPKPRTTKPAPGHTIYPYLLRHMTVERPNQVWAADITYIPIGRGFLYLVAVMDWASRAVLAWRLSNTMDVSFCVSALEEALARFGRPEIFNTDQGSQFTSAAFTGVLASAGIRISMDGRGRWMAKPHEGHWKLGAELGFRHLGVSECGESTKGPAIRALLGRRPAPMEVAA